MLHSVEYTPKRFPNEIMKQTQKKSTTMSKNKEIGRARNGNRKKESNKHGMCTIVCRTISVKVTYSLIQIERIDSVMQCAQIEKLRISCSIRYAYSLLGCYNVWHANVIYFKFRTVRAHLLAGNLDDDGWESVRVSAHPGYYLLYRAENWRKEPK